MTKPKRIIINEKDERLFGQLTQMAIQLIECGDRLGDEFIAIMSFLDWKELFAFDGVPAVEIPDSLSDFTEDDWRRLQMILDNRWALIG